MVSVSNRPEPEPHELEELHRGAAAAWPGVEVSLDRFGQAVDAAVADGASVGDLHANDLYLAVACLEAQPRALAILESDIMKAVRPSVERACRDGSVSPDDVMQGTLEKLLVAGKEAPRLTQYSGRGSLVGWVRVVAVREALQDRRRESRQRVHEDAAMIGGGGSSPPPELTLLRDRHQGAFRDAVKKAIAQLDAEQRAILRLSALEGLSIDQLAPLLGVHRATVARRLEKARAAALEHTQAILRRDHGLTESEARSLCAALSSEVDVSIVVALGAEPGS
jgi:RNA polymerase sigma-70 factor (ECF subfamily)